MAYDHKATGGDGWRDAKCLDVLRDQIDTRFPGRKTDYDGTIGDTSHQARKSEHNPNADGVVLAMDITNDPVHGCVSDNIAHALIESRDPRIQYIISNGKICNADVSPWVWRDYHGENPHDHHFHITAKSKPSLYDDTRMWVAISGAIAKPTPPVDHSTKPNFRSLAGGPFSSDPSDTSVNTSIRSNNPGAVNGADWEKAMPGYVGDVITSYSVIDGKRVANRTTIFESPEQGVAVWWELMRRYRDLYQKKTIRDIIKRYGGGQDYNEYEQFVVKKMGVGPTFVIDLADDDHLLPFAKAMFRYEAGQDIPWTDKQILYGFNLARKKNSAKAVGGAGAVIGTGVAAGATAHQSGMPWWAVTLMILLAVGIAIGTYVAIKNKHINT